MAEESIITKEMRDWLGTEGSGLCEVEKGHIKKFAQAVDDPNPLWQNEEYARKSKYGSIIAPPTFIQDDALHTIMPKLSKMKSPLHRHLYGGVELEFYKPMKVGDVLTARGKLVDLYEKGGKGGKLIFMVVETSFSNQQGELLVKGRHTFIQR